MLAQDSYWWVFFFVLIDQIGLPVPAAVTLISAGTKVREGIYAWPQVMAVSLAASLIGHSLWFALGRRLGVRVLHRLCRVSLEPQACVARIERLFQRWGPVGLVMARFVPGLDILAQPVAAIIGMHPLRWLGLTLAGGVLWAATLMALGYVVGEHLQGALTPARRAVGVYLTPILACGLIAIVGAVVLRRYRSILGLDVKRIGAEELKARMDAGEAFIVYDLRHPLQLRLAPYTLPGAQRFTRASLDRQRAQLSPPPAVVLFCNCLHEIASARLALALAREGVGNVFPLDGGLSAWARLKFPLAGPPR